MPGSLVDSLRVKPPENIRERVFALDPGLNILGWAVMDVNGTRPLVAPPTWSSIRFGVLRTTGKGAHHMDQAAAMVAAVVEHLRGYMVSARLVAVEAQQVYPDEDETKEETVAKANDLLRLAQVTGATQALAHSLGVQHVKAYLPAAWKGQTKKNVQHREFLQQLGKVPAIMEDIDLARGRSTKNVPVLDPDLVPKFMGHGFDAVCLAMVASEERLRRDSV